MTYIIGFPGAAFITDAESGTVTLAPGVPITKSTFPAQELVAGLVTDSDSFFAPTCTALAGGLVLLPPLFDADDAFHAPTVAPGAVTLSPILVPDPDTFWFGTVLRGAVSLLPGIIATDDSFPAPVVLLAQALLAALVTDSDTINAPVVSQVVPAARTLLPSRITDADAVYDPVVAVSVLLTLLPSRVTDADTFYAPVMGFDRTIRPPLVSAGEILYAAYSIDTAKPPKERTLRPGRLQYDDVVFQARLPLTVQPVVQDPEFIYAAILDISYPLTAAFVASDDSIKITFVAMQALPALVAADDAALGGVVSLFLVPALVTDEDIVPAADVGWQVIAEFTDDADEVFAAHAEAWYELLPEALEEDDVIDTYPFFLQAIIGGIPVPKPIALTGSVSQPRRLTGSLGSRTRLTGSISGPRRLTGSISRR